MKTLTREAITAEGVWVPFKDSRHNAYYLFFDGGLQKRIYEQPNGTGWWVHRGPGKPYKTKDEAQLAAKEILIHAQ